MTSVHTHSVVSDSIQERALGLRSERSLIVMHPLKSRGKDLESTEEGVSASPGGGECGYC